MNRILLWAIIPLLLFIGCMITLYKSPIQLFPLSPGFTHSTYSDSIYHNGNSQSTIQYASDSSLHISFILNEGYKWPYAGVDFNRNNYRPMNLNGYDYISLKMNLSEPQKFKFLIWFSVETDHLPDSLNRLVQQRELPLSMKAGTTEQQLYLNNFETPNWWYEDYKLTKNSIPRQGFKRVLNFAIRSNNQILNKPYHFKLKELNITSENKGVFTISLLFVILYYALLCVSLFIKKKRTVVVPLVDFELKERDTDQEFHQIQNYLASHYFDNTISLFRISQALSLPETIISKELKRKTGLTFKQYLNKLRMESALRLLKNTELSVKEISAKVGYNNTNHFFRVFKSYFQRSPSDFRK